MTAPSVGIKDLLVSAGVGAFGASAGWSIRIGRMKDHPDTLITIYDTPGVSPEPRLDINRPSCAVIVRGNQNGYVDTYAKAEEVRNTLLGLPSQTINGDLWAHLTMSGDILHMGYDEKERPMFSLNFQIILHQGDLDGTHRISC